MIYGALTSLSIGMADLFGRRVVNAKGPIVTGAAMQLVAIMTSLVTVVVVSSRFIVGDVIIGALLGAAGVSIA